MSEHWKPQAVLLATDLTSGSNVAADTAMEVARRFHTEVRIVHVFQYLAHHRYRVSVGWMLEQVRRDTTAKLRRLRQRIEATKCPAQVQVIESEDPAGAILKALETFERAIVVLRTHARDPIERFFLGSTAEQVLRTTRFPVISVGPHVKRTLGEGADMLMFATDLTERSLEPVPLFPCLMTSTTQLTVVHVTESVLETDAEAVLDPVRIKLSLYLPEHIIRQQVHWKVVRSSSPVQALLDVATKEKADLLIMGMHRSGELNAHLPLKTGFQIIVAAPCAVLTVCS